LLLPQPARVTAVAAAARTRGTRTQALSWRARDLLCPGVIFIMTKTYQRPEGASSPRTGDLPTGTPLLAGHRASRTGSASRPWMSVLGRQRSEAAGTASLIEPNLASRPETAIPASSRASGAPRQ
jgi:hypothetical protein